MSKTHCCHSEKTLCNSCSKANSAGRNYSILLFNLCLLFLISCSNSKRLSNQNLSLLYNTDETMLHPQYTVFHFGDDSSRFYFHITANDLLFKRNEENNFQANVVLNFELVPSYESTTMLDSGTISLHFIQDSSTVAYSGFVDFKMQRGNQALLKITCRDINRNHSAIYFDPINKRNPQSSPFYLLKDEHENVFFSNIFKSGERFSLQNNSIAIKNLSIRYYKRNFPLAAPPFHLEDLPVFDYKADSLFTLQVDTHSTFAFVNPGIYHLQNDTLTKDGLTIIIFKDDFPTPSSATQLIESLRYLTTREEHSELLNSSDPKKAVDTYWLDRAGNQDRARKLIREYYIRVQEANRLFTSYLEGWKTDRGMIYIVFGPPQTIYHNDKTEQWIYGSRNNLPDLEFVFAHINNPFTNNDYYLLRNLNDETPWYMAVDEWRNGRVVNEY